MHSMETSNQGTDKYQNVLTANQGKRTQGYKSVSTIGDSTESLQTLQYI